MGKHRSGTTAAVIVVLGILAVGGGFILKDRISERAEQETQAAAETEAERRPLLTLKEETESETEAETEARPLLVEPAETELANLDVWSTVKVLEEPEIGQIITFGHYEQDNNFANGDEPIEWRVLEVSATQALLVSEYALDAQGYMPSRSGTTWEDSTLRDWLNYEFYYKAFSNEEMSRIITRRSSNPDNTYNGAPVDGGNDTEDQVFLLSIDEAEQLFYNDIDRQCMPTAYAAGKIWGKLQENGYCYWWLRSPGRESSCTSDVVATGRIGYKGRYNGDLAGVRPAILIRLG